MTDSRSSGIPEPEFRTETGGTDGTTSGFPDSGGPAPSGIPEDGPIRLRAAALLYEAGPTGMAGTRVVKALAAEGHKVARSTVYRWLRLDAVDGGYGLYLHPVHAEETNVSDRPQRWYVPGIRPAQAGRHGSLANWGRYLEPQVVAVLVARAATLFVAVTAFRLAYAGSRGAAIDAGIPEGDAGWYPLCIEGVLVVAAVCTVLLEGPLPWAVLLGFSGLSIAANVVHALDHGALSRGPLGWFSLLIAAVPPAALPLCVHMAFGGRRAHKHPNEHANERASEQPNEQPNLVLVSTPNEHADDAHLPPEPDAHEQPDDEPMSTRPRRRVSTASRASNRRQVSATLVGCDPGCSSTDRAGQVCAGRDVSPATRTRHRQQRRSEASSAG